MNKFIAPRYGEILDKKKWVVYTYLVSKAWYGCDDNQQFRRGQVSFKSSDISWLMSESYVRKILRELQEEKLIHKQEAEKDTRNGNLITICNYDEVCKLVVRGECEVPPEIERGQHTDLYSNISSSCEVPTAHGLKECEVSYIVRNTKEDKEDNISETIVSSTPKKTRKKSEIPEWVAKLYLSKLAEHCNQTLEKVNSGDKKQLEKLFKAVTDEEKMSKLFTYYFTLKDDYYLSRGFPLGLLVKNQDTFFRAIGNSTHTTITERRF
jgi:hypothetical protein